MGIREFELHSDERKEKISNEKFLMLGGVASTKFGCVRLRQKIEIAKNSARLNGELKWGKISNYYLDAYLRVLDVFFEDANAVFSTLLCNRSGHEWSNFLKRMRRVSEYDDPLASVYYQFLLVSLGRLYDDKRWRVFPDAGYFSRDNRVHQVVVIAHPLGSGRVVV